jgi:xanthine dehydrogenase YagS FAD-binding subunit
MKDDLAAPKRLVNIKDIPDLKGVSFNARTGLRIGATATIQQLIGNADVRRHYPALVQAAEGISSPQIRSMGTCAGDLCQRPRCWYYRGGHGLLAQDESGKSLVVDGDNRYHAILGNMGPAYFVSPSSLGPALIAYGAKLQIFGPKGAREMAVEKFFVTPGSPNEREQSFKPNEIVTEIIVPLPASGTRSATYEIRQKEALDWPLATASVVLEMRGNEVKSARVVMGHVAPVPWSSDAAGQALAGKAISQETANAAGEAAVRGAKGLSRNGYKIQLAKVAVKRALLEAARGGAK